MSNQVRSPIEQAIGAGLVAGTTAIIALKLLTGLALMPLLVVFLMVFGVVGMLRLRLLRMSGPGATRRQRQ